MRFIHVILVGMVVLLLGAVDCLAQPNGQFRRGRGPGNFDPNAMFDRLAKGKEVLSRSDITDPRRQRTFDRIAEALGVTNGQLTRQQFTTGMQQLRSERQGGWQRGPQGPGNNPAGAAPNQGGPGGGWDDPKTWSARAEEFFHRLDKNGDGLLNADEMPENLSAEKDKWDTDHNGFIDLNEYKAYFQAHMQQWLKERNASGWNRSRQNSWAGQIVIAPATPEPEHRPVVYHFDNLPKELPSWFKQLDTDKDAQIGLYEWKASGRSIEEFEKIDLNHDGFLTVDEVLRYEAQRKALARAAGGSGYPVTANPRRPVTR